MRMIFASLALPLAAILLTASPARAIEFHFYKITISMTLSIQGDDGGVPVVETLRLTNKQIINLHRGRALAAPVPREEILVAILPVDFREVTTSRTAVINKDTNAVLAEVGFVEDAFIIYGKPDGFRGVGFSQGKINAASNSTMAVAETPVTSTGKGLEKETRTGPLQAIRMSAVAGRTTVTQGGTPRQAVITKGSTRIFGKPLAQVNLP